MATRNPSEEESPQLRQWMADYQAGSAEAFDRLYAALAGDLHAYLTTLARDPTRADDLLQETFLQLHRSRASHIPGHPLRPWVFAIAKRVFLMQQRGAGRRTRRELNSGADITAQAGSTSDQLIARRQLEDALGRIPAERRRPFLLHHLFGFSFREIAAKLGINAGAAKVRSSRARQDIRTILEDTDDKS